jgi:hypothetical protein
MGEHMRAKIKFLTTATAFIAIVGQGSFAASLKDAEVAFTSGNWKVLRYLDSMKDTVVCTGIYKEKYGVQLTSNTLYVSVRGGLQSVTLRFSDKPARRLRLPEEMEKKIGSIIISGSDFSELVESDRLRVEASTLVSGIANEDLDLTGIKEALESVKSGCPVQPKIMATQKAEKSAVSPCTDVMVSRMKAQGLNEGQILAICKE